MTNVIKIRESMLLLRCCLNGMMDSNTAAILTVCWNVTEGKF